MRGNTDRLLRGHAGSRSTAGSPTRTPRGGRPPDAAAAPAPCYIGTRFSLEPHRFELRSASSPPGAHGLAFRTSPFPLRSHLTDEFMTDLPMPALSTLLPRELVAELLGLARASGATFSDLFAEHAIVTSFSLDEDRLKSAAYAVLQGVGVRSLRRARDRHQLLARRGPPEERRLRGAAGRRRPRGARRADRLCLRGRLRARRAAAPRAHV